MRKLGRTHVPVRMVPIDDIVRGEFDENAVRADFLPSEYAAIKRALAAEERRQARERQRVGGELKAEASGNLPLAAKGRAGDKIANAAGVGRRTLEKADAVVVAAERDPDRFGMLVEEMDRTGRVDGVYRKLVIAEKAEAIRNETPPLPQHGPYRVIVADPPWAYAKRPLDASKLGTCPYPQMSIEAIRALPVTNLAHDDAILWLWTTNAHMREAFGVLDAWGFEHKTIVTWIKNRIGRETGCAVRLSIASWRCGASR